MLRQLILNSKSVSSLLQPNGWPKQHLSFLTRTTSRRWKSDQTRAYKAAVLEEFNEKLSVESITNRTKLGDGMIRVGVKYCSLNLIDVQYMQEKNDEIILPMVPGCEFSGEVIETGENCKQNVKAGDKVASLLAYRHLGGGLAEECVVHEDECFDIGSVSLKNAAVLLQGHASALLAFTKYCELQADDIVIVIAGPAGNGLAAIQLASSVFKAKVYAICDTEDSSALIRNEGADKSISIHEGYAKVYSFLRKALDGKKAKLVYDGAGGGLIHLAADFIDADGHILTADPFFDPEEFQRQEPKFEKKSPKTEEKPGNPTSDLISKIKRIELSDYRVNDIQMYRQIIEDTIALCEDEIISPYISQCFKLKDINDAVDFIKKKKCTGKVLIDLKLKNSSDETTTTDKKDD